MKLLQALLMWALASVAYAQAPLNFNQLPGANPLAAGDKLPVQAASGVCSSSNATTGGTCSTTPAAISTYVQSNLGALFSSPTLTIGSGNYTGPNATQNSLGQVVSISGGPITNGPYNASDFSFIFNNFKNTSANSLIAGINFTTTFVGTSALGGFSGLSTDILSGTTSGNVGGQYVSATFNGGLGWKDNGGPVTFTAAPTGTSATLSANWSGPTNSAYKVLFSDGEIRYVALTNGATTATWGAALTGAPTANAAAYSGTLYGFNPNISLSCNGGANTQPCAIDMGGLVGGEIDLNVPTNTSALEKIGLQIVEGGNDAVSATGENIGYSLNNASSSPGWQMGYALGSFDGAFPMAANGTILGCWQHGTTFQETGVGANCGTTAYGVDFSGAGNGGYPVQFTGSPFASVGFNVDNTGSVHSPTYTCQGTNCSNYVESAGTGNVYIGEGGTGIQQAAQFFVDGAGGDWFQFHGTTTGSQTVYMIPSSVSDANVTAQVRSKGTGCIDLNPSGSTSQLQACPSGVVVGNPTNGQLGTGTIDAASIIVPGTYTISGLPACASSIKGALASVSNGVASPTYFGTVSTTGTATDPVYCNYNGTTYQWVYH